MKGPKIKWTDATWNPIVNLEYGNVLDIEPEHILTQPMDWKRGRRIQVSPKVDLFGEDVRDDWIDKIFTVMALCPQHAFQVLTKNAEVLRNYMETLRSIVEGDDVNNLIHLRISQGAQMLSRNAGQRFWVNAPSTVWQWVSNGLPNVWLGVHVSSQQEADERIPRLLQTPAAVRFISVEPLLGPINLRGWETYDHGCAGELGEMIPRIDWVVAGGEWGKNAKPMHPEWIRSLRDQCSAAGVPFFFTQDGEWLSVRDDDGQISYAQHKVHL